MVMSPSLVIGAIPFYDTPSEIEGSPYWVDLWADVNGYKIGLQIKPSTYKSASASFFMGGARSSEENGHRMFRRDYGGKVFIVVPINGRVSTKDEEFIIAEYNRLLLLPCKQ